MFKPSFIQIASSLILSCCIGASVAQSTDERSQETEALPIDASNSTISTDFQLPVSLDSRTQNLDGKNKTSIFIDNVIIRQGSLELLADRVEVDAGGGPGKEIIMASGQPASYKQRKDDGTMVEARANEITYLVEPRTISLKGNALIMQNEVQVTGDSIVFDMTKEQILASTDDNSEQSVRTVISPGAFENKDEDKRDDGSPQENDDQQNNDEN
uniref:lipopolysaccharide transport periplasmic protein LptA n=1 Tax=Ningiella ruwaisensis TaxID=2364274 RepID=UPI00109F0AD0|nr:lipopolysaccharide transport periplasmic protein LptA [Ningiella ruwaisensis]